MKNHILYMFRAQSFMNDILSLVILIFLGSWLFEKCGHINFDLQLFILSYGNLL